MKWYLELIVSIVFVVITNSTLIAQNTITWRKTFLIPGATPSYIHPSKEGYFITGLYNMNGPRLFIMSIDDYGDSLWFKHYNLHYSQKMFDANDSHYVIITSRGDFVKVDNHGDTIFTKINNRDIRCNNSHYMNKYYYLCGQNNLSNYNPVLLLLDSLGNEIYYREYPFLGAARDFFIKDSHIYIVGDYYPNIFLLKTDSVGEFRWTQNYNLNMFNAPTILEFSDKIIVGGSGKPLLASGSSATLSRFDLSGNLEWHKTYDPGSPFYGSIEFVLNAFTGNMITFGVGSRSVMDPQIHEQRLISFDYEGNEIWRKQYGFENEFLDAMTFIQTSDSGYIFSGRTVLETISEDDGLVYPHVIKTDKLGNVKPTSIHSYEDGLPDGIKLYPNFPNPFNSSTIIKFESNQITPFTMNLFDVAGQFVETISSGVLQVGSFSINYSPKSSLSSGVYYYVLKTRKSILSRKLLYLK